MQGNCAQASICTEFWMRLTLCACMGATQFGRLIPKIRHGSGLFIPPKNFSVKNPYYYTIKIYMYDVAIACRRDLYPRRLP